MFILVNTFNAIPGNSAGTVISRHRSLEAAEAAAKRLQRAVKRHNGVGSYLPTEIYEVTRAPRGRWVTLDYLADARVAAAEDC